LTDRNLNNEIVNIVDVTAQSLINNLINGGIFVNLLPTIKVTVFMEVL